MKRFSLVTLAILFLLTTHAFAKHAELAFKAAPDEQIQLIMDGRLVNSNPAPAIVIQERPGLHTLKIRVFNRYGRLKFTHHEQLHIRPHSRNSFILESHPFYGSRLLQLKDHPLPAKPKLRRQKAAGHYTPRLSKLSDEEYYQLKDAVSLQTSDRARLRIAQRALQQRLVYAEDVKELMFLFAFESSRLVFAKWAYARVLDPENYQEVYLAFRYETSIMQLENSLRQ